MEDTNEKGSRLVLISNGEPYAHEFQGEKIVRNKLAGGLTTGLDPMMQKDKGLWIAWGRGEADFEVVDKDNKVKVPDENGYSLKRIDLSMSEKNGFYYGFSNEVLWPICHSFNNIANFKPVYWNIYRDVNQKYAEAAVEEIKEDDMIWVHDYHLTLVPSFIKKQKKNAKISFFWHIPWPSWESFRTIPWKKEIMNGMLSSDFIGFHTPLFVKNFLRCAHKLGAKVDFEKNIITYNDHKTRVTSIPLGIDYNNFKELSTNKSLEKKAKELKEYYHAEKLIFGVDRLDYTKGILERLKAMDLLFEKYPQYIGKITLVQRTSPSRTEVEKYQEMRREIDRTIAHINGKYQQDEWTPIKNFDRSVPQEKLLPYYRAADIALVTPLIDGMNLVAKEYVAAQDNGVLILSDFAGASRVLNDALLVNPYHIEEVTENIHKALQMSEDDKLKRLNSLKNKVKKYDINWWRDIFLEKWAEVYE
ncbi:MAG: alpha,alpha-trehalose-phosphate synthase (UDP-forming) [Halothermotrichaceae bacterium]